MKGPLIALLVLISNIWLISSEKCSAGSKISLKFLEGNANARCADGTPAGYYVSVFEEDQLAGEQQNRSYVIWLGDTQTCSGQACIDLCEGSSKESISGICEGVPEDLSTAELSDQQARCLASRATCTSEWWSTFKELNSETILCSEDEDFGEFKRVFLPSCSLDYWLGNENANTVPSGGFSQFLFRGNTIFQAIIDDLIAKENLIFAPKVVLGGTRGGGIGALHQSSFLRQRLKNFIDNNATLVAQGIQVPTVYTVADSSWIVPLERFAPTDEEKNDEKLLFTLNAAYQVNSSEWIERAQIFQSCADKYSTEERYKCLFPYEVVKFHLNDVSNVGVPTSSSNKVLFIQSQYNLLQLEDLGIVNLDAEKLFEDEASFAQGALNYIENFGQQVRSSIEAVSRFVSEGNVFFFTPACGQHQYIVPTRIHAITNTKQKVGDLGDIGIEIDELAWTDITSGVLSARETLVLFVNDRANQLQQVARDSCGEFLCNQECITKVFPFEIVPLVSTCIQQLVLVYAFFLVFALVFFFFLSYLQVQTWRSVCDRFWNMTKTIEAQIPKNLDNKKFTVFDRTANENREMTAEDEEFEFLKNLAIQRNQTADEVQEQLMIETNADSQYRRVHLMTENLCYWAEPRAPTLSQSLMGLCSSKTSEPGKQIIRNVSLSFEPGKVHALMGPSGSGKTTFLELISLSKQSGRMSGSRYINGISANAKIGEFMKTWLLHNQSYVSQQDYFFPTLTVREHLEHCAWMILPEYMPDETKLNRVWQLIRLLDLTQCADTPCGDGGVNYEGGISGGQRRRLSVATQLLSNPCALFLDEPTSGLDSVSALNLVRRLQKFASKSGMNVIMTIHQPRREIYGELDRLYILVKGSLVFSGSVDSTANFFGLDMQNERMNVGNELLDILKDMNQHDDPRILEFQRKFHESTEYQSILDEIKGEKTYLTKELAAQIREVLVLNSLAEGRYSWQSPSSVFWLQWVLLSRTLKRGGLNLFMTLTLSLFAGLILGGLFFDADSYNSKVGLAYLCVSTLTFLQGVFLARRYFDEKDMFDFEKRSGAMRSWQAFLFAQFSRDAVTSMFESLTFALPAYFLAGFSLEADRVLVFVVLSVLIGYATTSQNVFIQIDRNEVRSAATVQIGLLALGALFNGFIVNLDDLPVYYSWIPYLMLNFYGFVGILINELHSFSLPCDLSILECASRTGDVVIRTFSYDQLDVFICALALILLILATRSAGIYDFYYRYASTGRIQKVAPDGKSKPEKKPPPTEEQLNGAPKEMKGQNIDKILRAQETSVIFKKEGKDVDNALTKKNSKEDVKTGDGKTQLNQLQQLQAETRPTSAKPPPGLPQVSSKRFKPEEEKDEEPPVAPKKPKQVVEDDIIYDEDEEYSEDAQDDEDDQGIDSNGWVSFLISRYAIAGFFVFDLATAGYVCLFDGDNGNLLIAISAFYVVVYTAQFFLQLGYLIPFTLENSHRDFVWATELDGPSLVLLIVDICLAFLQFGVSNDLGIRQIMTLTIRFVRLVRIQLYFYKGSKAHRIRAQSFLKAKHNIVMEYINKMNEDAAFEARHKVKSGNNWLKNLKTSGNMQNYQMYMNNAGTRLSGRPQRPQRPDRASMKFGRNSRSQSFHNSHHSGNRLSMGHNALLDQQMARFQHAAQRNSQKLSSEMNQPGSRGSNRISSRLSYNGQRSLVRSKPKIPKSMLTKENGWSKYKNDKTGQIIFYNHKTGQWVDVKDVDDDGPSV